MKKLLWLVSCFLFCFEILGAVDLYITNDVADMVAAKRICVRVNLDVTEQALYKDSLCFSVDTPELELKSWRTSAQESLQYVPLLKRAKKLYLQSFNIELVIDFDMQDKIKQALLLNKTTLYVAALSLKKQGENKVVNLMIPLAEPVAHDYSFTTSFKSLATSLSTTVTTSWFGWLLNKQFFLPKKNVNTVNSELLVVDRLKDLWLRTRALIVSALTSGAFYYWYFGFVFLIIFLLFLQRRNRYLMYTRWFWEFEIIMVLVLCAGLLIMCRGLVPRFMLYKIFGFMCIPCALYFLWGGEETFWRRVKILVGLVCATAVLPLLVKGYLLQYLEVFSR